MPPAIRIGVKGGSKLFKCDVWISFVLFLADALTMNLLCLRHHCATDTAFSLSVTAVIRHKWYLCQRYCWDTINCELTLSETYQCKSTLLETTLNFCLFFVFESAEFQTDQPVSDSADAESDTADSSCFSNIFVNILYQGPSRSKLINKKPR